MGDPGGVGPEIILKALTDERVGAALEPVLVGSKRVLQLAAENCGCPLPEEVVQPPDLGNETFVTGVVDARNGGAACQCIVHATHMALDGKVAAICTAPISKEALYAAGVHFPGHTELIAHECGDSEVRMMLEGGGLHVVLETIHVALADVPKKLTVASILRSIQICAQWGRKFIGPEARLAVCGLNPHAGEAGHFGREEIEVIAPAIERAKSQGIIVSGPYPGDTVFHRSRKGDFDMVLAMFHDQALIPVKTLDFDRGVNVSIGLPIIRTSPDHGTAFDIAGKGIANPSSMISALLRAAELATR